jgi:hypothetical protein
VPGRVGQKGFVHVVGEPYLLVSTLITPLHITQQRLACPPWGQPLEQDRSHENQDTETREDFAPAVARKSIELKHILTLKLIWY